MKNRKQKLLAAIAALVGADVLVKCMEWRFPEIPQSSSAGAATITILFLLAMAVPMFYLAGLVAFYFFERVENLARQQRNARYIPNANILFLIWFALSGFFCISGFSSNFTQKWILMKRGAFTTGEIVESDFGKMTKYRFRVGQRLYIREDALPFYENLKPGGRVRVLYDSLDPQTAILTSVKPQIWDMHRSNVAAIGIFGTFLLVAIFVVNRFIQKLSLR